MKLLGMSWRQWLCLAAVLSHIRIESTRIGLGSDDVHGSNRTELDPITIAGFAIGTAAALGSLYSFSKTIMERKIRAEEKRDARQILRQYSASLATHCMLIDRYYEYLDARQREMIYLETMGRGLAEFCRVQNDSLVHLPRAVNMRFAKECESANVSAAQALCREYLQKTMPESLADVCTIGNHGIQADLNIRIAELRGLRKGVCPKQTVMMENYMAAPTLTEQNVPLLLDHYPKCKHMVERAPSAYCWSSCSPPQKVRAACSKISFQDAGITARTFAGMRTEKKCRRAQRALCRVTLKDASLLQESGSTALQGNSSPALQDPGFIISVFGLAYALIGVVDFGADIVDTLAKQASGFKLLSDFLADSYREQRAQACVSAAKMWVHVASSHAIESAIASWRYGNANLPELITEIEDVRGETITSSTWAVVSGSDANMLESSSNWSCSNGCLTASKAQQTQVNASWISDLGSAISGDWSGRTAANPPRKSVEDCKTNLNDWRVCASGGDPFVMPTECFKVTSSEGLPLLAFHESSSCQSYLMRIRNSNRELSEARKELIEVCRMAPI